MGETVAILLAAGTSQRMGDIDKLWTDLGGEPVIGRSLGVLASHPAVDRVLVVAPAARHEALCALAPAGAVVRCVEGGARRQDSVAAGLAAAAGAAWYLVHDGARPLIDDALVSRVLEGARAGGEAGAAVPGVAVSDTVKRVAATGRVEETLERASLRAIQTPQAFAGALLRRAHAEVQADATDDAAMVEALGASVVVVAGEDANVKITTPADVAVAAALLAARDAASGGRSEGS